LLQLFFPGVNEIVCIIDDRLTGISSYLFMPIIFSGMNSLPNKKGTAGNYAAVPDPMGAVIRPVGSIL